MHCSEQNILRLGDTVTFASQNAQRDVLPVSIISILSGYIFFMFLAGTNFVLIYFGLLGKFKKIINDTEFKWYVSFIGVFVLITTLSLFFSVDLNSTTVNHPEIYGKFESSFRHSLFQVVAIVTTTGFVTGDFVSWTPFLTMLFFGIMFMGGSSGSTSGGVKVLRHLILIKNGLLEFKRSLHPNAIFPLRHNNHGFPGRNWPSRDSR